LLRFGQYARPTADGHDRTTDAPKQRFNGAKLRATLAVGVQERGHARSEVTKTRPRALEGPRHPIDTPTPVVLVAAWLIGVGQSEGRAAKGYERRARPVQ